MKLILFSLLSSTLLVSCASKQERMEIETKAAQSTVTDSKTLGQSIEKEIQTSSSLSQDQKLKLEKIFTSNKQKAEDLEKESYKFRSVLINELLGDETLDQKKIKIIKNNIKKIEKQRLTNTFETIEQISEVVSGSPDKQNFSQSLIYFDRGNR